MKARIHKRGKSFAIRIPKSLAFEAGIGLGDLVELSLTADGIVIRSSTEEDPSLAALLKQVTPNNLHGEWNTGPDVGREAWAR
jgi:antitoxin MazE